MINSFKYLTAIIFSFLAVISCSKTDDGYDRKVMSAAALIDSHPDSALMLLDSINTDRLGRDKAIVHYLKGKASLNMLNYPAAMEEFLHAGNASLNTGNDSTLLLSRIGMMDISDSVYDYNEKIRYALDICEIYERQNRYDDILETLVKLLNSPDVNDRNIHPQYIDRLSHFITLSDTLTADSATDINRNYYPIFLSSMCNRNNTEIYLCPELNSFNVQKFIDLIKSHGDWRSVITNDSTVIFYDNAHLIINILWNDGYDNEARDFISFYRKHYTEKRIAYDLDSPTNHIRGHLESASNVPVYTSLMRTFQSDIKSTVTKYHYEEELMHTETIEFQRTLLIMLSLLSAVIVIAVCLYVHIVKSRHSRINDNNIRTAAELRNTLNDLEDLHIKTLSHLCNTYYDSYNKASVKSKIAKEALQTINEIAESDDFISKLETRLNEQHTGLATYLRNEMDDLKESDYNLFLCNAVGLTIPAICLMLKESRDVIYARRLRLRNKILEANPPHADLFLKYLR
ncbi:MAG: hypothetical protein HDS01_08840 [Bacteroides sp.]|nr:hypothetical protein [Bacteroides sp.]